MSKIPLKVARRLGRHLGGIAYLFLPGRRAVALNNLELAFGDTLSFRERKGIARDAFMNFGVMAMEFPRISKLSSEELFAHGEVRGLEHLNPKKGAILVSSHTANWEWMAPLLVAHGYALAIVVNTYRDAKRGRIFNGMRESGSVRTIPKDEAAKDVPTFLEAEKTLVGVLADQSARLSAVPVRSFGHPCWTTAGPAILALREHIPVHVTNVNREPDGTYVLEIHAALEYEWTGEFRRDLCGFGQVVQDGIDAHIREYPGQWLWMHKRWKKRPELEEKWSEYIPRD